MTGMTRQELERAFAAIVDEDSGEVRLDGQAFVEGLRVFASRTGLCQIETATVNPSGVSIRASNSVIARGYGRSHRPVCHYLRGFLLAAGEHLLNRRELECQEGKCIAVGDTDCEFTIGPLPGSRAGSPAGGG